MPIDDKERDGSRRIFNITKFVEFRGEIVHKVLKVVNAGSRRLR